MKSLITALSLASATVLAAVPRDAVPLDSGEIPQNYRLHVEFSAPSAGAVRLGPQIVIPLQAGAEHDVAVEHPANGASVLRVWSGGKLVRGPEELKGSTSSGTQDFPAAKLDLGADFTAVVKFESRGNGTLFSKCAPTGKWTPDAKALYIRDGRLIYDIGWLGEMTGAGKVTDGKPHTAAPSRIVTTAVWGLPSATLPPPAISPSQPIS